MKIEFNTVFSEAECRRFSEYVTRYCSPEYNKNRKKNIILISVLVAVGGISGIISRQYEITSLLFIAFIAYIALLIYNRKKAIPKANVKYNIVGCPYNVKYAFFDEYFYEKFQNNMIVEEIYVKYEFLDYIVETPDCFLLLTKRRMGHIFFKNYMNPEDVAVLSDFFKTKYSGVYKFEKK